MKKFDFNASKGMRIPLGISLAAIEKDQHMSYKD
jgi:hypothetical protein